MKITSRILYALAYGFWLLLSLLPFWALYVLSDLLYLLIGKLVRYRHRVIWNNLTTSFPEKSEEELRTIEKAFYRWFCDYVVETIKLMTISKKKLMRHMTFTGLDEFNQVLREGQSCAVYLGHYGNWEWITSLSYWVPEDVLCTQLYHPLENESFDKLFKYVRERQQGVCIPMQDSLRTILGYKRDQQTIVVGYIADQKPHWVNIHRWIPFLNHDTPVLTGSERIIRKTREAVFYGDMRRIRRGYYNCEMKLVTREPQDMEEFEVTDVYFRLLEETIRREPPLWLWSHDQWKRTHEEFDRRFYVKDGKVVARK